MQPLPPPRIRRESELLRAMDMALRERLPEGWELKLSLAEPVGRRIADAVLTFTAPDGARGVAAVQAKLRIDGRDLESVVAQVRELTVDLPADAATRGPPIVAARFLSPRVRAKLEAQAINYADATGNIRIAFSSPGLFIADSGASRDPVPEDRGLRSLAGRAAVGVVRALFDAKPPVKVRDVRDHSGASLGTVSRVFELLEREAVVDRDPRGTIVGIDRAGLIERWIEDYNFTTSNTTKLFLEPRRLERLLERLQDVPFRYAVTGSLAARVIAEYAEAKLAMVYVESIDEAAEGLGLTPVESGGNVMLAEPFDSLVLKSTRERDGVRYAPLAQVAADLLTAPGRGPAEGEELLRTLASVGHDG